MPAIRDVGARFIAPACGQTARWRCARSVAARQGRRAFRLVHRGRGEKCGLAARGESRVAAKNGDCHLFALRHEPRSKPRGPRRIGWLYPFFAALKAESIPAELPYL